MRKILLLLVLVTTIFLLSVTADDFSHNKIYLLGKHRLSPLSQREVFNIFILDPQTKHISKLTEKNVIGPFSISSDGEKILINSSDDYPNIYFLDIRDNSLKSLPIVSLNGHLLWLTNNRSIVFFGENSDEIGTYIVDVEGFAPPIKLIDIELFNFNSTPDGKKIIFNVLVKNEYDGSKSDGEKWIIKEEGQELFSSWAIGTIDLDNKKFSLLAKGNEPKISPDGKKILYEDSNLYVIDIEGNNKIQIVESILYKNLPAILDNDILGYAVKVTDYTWSPNGENIAFIIQSAPLKKNQESAEISSGIYIMNINGTNKKLLVQGEPNVTYYELIYSPDNQKLAFVQTKNEKSEVYVINIDGSNLERLTNNDISESDLFWQHRKSTKK